MAQTNVQAFSGDVEISGGITQGNQVLYPQRRWEIDLTSGTTTDRFYPTYLASSSPSDVGSFWPINFKVFGESLIGSDPYNEETLIGYARGGGFSDHRAMCKVQSTRFAVSDIRFQGLWEGTSSFQNGFVIYMRGGYKYSILTDASTVVENKNIFVVGGSTYALKNSAGVDAYGTSVAISQVMNVTDFVQTGDVTATTGSLILPDSTARLGIGKTNPGSALDVVGDVAISSNLAVDTNTLFVDSVGNKVGIGTANPQATLDVQGTGNFTGKLSLPIGVSSNPSLQLGTNTTYTDEQLYSLRWGGSGLLGMGLHSSTRGTFGKQGLLIHIPNTEEYSVKTNGWADIFSLDGATKKAYFGGNVGIGTASPDTLLHLEDSVPTIRFVDTDTVVDGNQQLGGIEFYSRDTTGSGYPNYELASIKCVNAANAASAPDGELTFSTGRHVGTGILEMMRINADGNVGIGTASPGYKLHIEQGGGVSGNGIFISNSNYGSMQGVNISMINAGTYNYGSYASIQPYRSGVAGTTDLALCPTGGDVGIGTVSPGAKFHVLGNTLFQGRHTFYSQIAPPGNGGNITNHDQKALAIGNQGVATGSDWGMLQNSDNNLYFYYGLFSRGYLQSGVNVGAIDFTGQHRNFIDGVSYADYDSLEGLIVSANKNKYYDIDENVTTGANAIQISQSLPLVSLSTTQKDKACFGVISGIEDPETREYTQGSFVSMIQKQKGDRRAFINSVGEGAIWVTNINGSLESGDYITTSNVAGYGQKQDSEFLANYTVAKITMDCDFEPVTQPIQQIKKELEDVNYWVKTTYENVSEEEYSNLADESRRIVDDIYQEIIKEESKTEQEGYELEVRQELVNVLDEHGQIQWEDDPSGATEKAYKIRYLDADGVETDEANAVHKAAFVGCTYHCG